MSVLVIVADQSLQSILQDLVVLFDSFNHLTTVHGEDLSSLRISIKLNVLLIGVDFVCLFTNLTVSNERAL